MVKELSVHALVWAAGRVGVTLTPVDAGGNLYVWHTPAPDASVVYIGKSDSENRLKNERTWMRSDVSASIFSGIVTLLRVQSGEVPRVQVRARRFRFQLLARHRRARPLVRPSDRLSRRALRQRSHVGVRRG